MDASRRPIPRPPNNSETILNTVPLEVEALLITDTPQRDDPTAIAISIVSNSRLLSEGLLAILSPLLNLRLIEIYSGEFHANSPLPNPPGHVILLDSGVGHVSALAWTRHWHGLRPPGYILLVELTNNVELILECLEAGAGGYLLQETSGVEMVEAIKDARVGIAHCSPEIIARLVARQAAQITITHASPSPLTAREVEVLRWIAAGYTNLEIAGELFIELRTVKQHVHHILGKLHVRSRWEVARLAAERGWIDPISPLR